MSPAPRRPPHPLRRCPRARGGAPSTAGITGTRTSTRTRTWIRVLVLLVIALLATGPHPEALAAPLTTTNTIAASGIAEHDVLDTALRPPTRQGNHPLAPLRPATGHPEQEPRTRRLAPAPAPPAHSATLHALRCVVLRC